MSDTAVGARKYRKKPVVIEAMQLTEDSRIEVWRWMVGEDRAKAREFFPRSQGWVIRTLEGDMKADWGDWIIKGVKGEFYPCKPDIFAATYEPVE